MQQSTELVVVTYAQTLADKESIVQARIRVIIDTLRSAPGLTASRFYRGHEDRGSYVLITTWDDEESWLKAQQRHNPKHLLLANRELLVSPPEQWVLTYTWGYQRPIAPPTLASVHLLSLPTRKIDQARQHWLAELRQPDIQSLLTFSFLAQGISDTPTATRIARPGAVINGRELFKPATSLLLGFYSWSSESERTTFYESAPYQRLQSLEEQASNKRIIPLKVL